MEDEARTWSAPTSKLVATSTVLAAWQLLTDDRVAAGGRHHYSAILLASLASAEPPQLSASGANHSNHVLFFEGGSAGTLDPAGPVRSSSPPVRTAQIVWSAALSLAHPSTTNNIAEYRGVVERLRAASSHGWRGLAVVGDSLVILRQLQHYKPPRSPKLLPLYAHARRLADQLDVSVWHHHLRAHNKMADAAANVAMDTGRSIISSAEFPRPELLPIHSFSVDDVAHWRELRVEAGLPS